MTQHAPFHDDLVVELRVPGDVAMVEVVRAMVGRVARLAGFSLDGIEDLALAVDEAATLVLLQSQPEGLNTKVALDKSDLQISLTPIGTASWSVDELTGTTRWELLQALCDQVDLTSDDAPSLTLTQRSC